MADARQRPPAAPSSAPAPPTKPVGYSIKDYAVLWQVSTRTVERWLALDKLEVTRTPGGAPRIVGIRPSATPAPPPRGETTPRVVRQFMAQGKLVTLRVRKPR